jgi:hypothetical protein
VSPDAGGPMGRHIGQGSNGMVRFGSKPSWSPTPGFSSFSRIEPEILRNKGHSRAFASRHRRSEARHVRGFAGRFRDVWPRVARSAAPVRFGTSVLAGRKIVGAMYASASLPVTFRAAFLVLRPLTCVVVSPIMCRSLAVASTHRLSQSPFSGALYADR